MTNNDRELCDWLAVHWMGWHDGGDRWLTGRVEFLHIAILKTDWNPVEDANDTQRLKARLRELGYAITMQTEEDGLWLVELWKDKRASYGDDKNELRAVCLAAKAAKESE